MNKEYEIVLDLREPLVTQEMYLSVCVCLSFCLYFYLLFYHL